MCSCSCSRHSKENKKRVVRDRATDPCFVPRSRYLQFRGSDPAGGRSRPDTGRSRLHGRVLPGVRPGGWLLRKVYRLRATRFGPGRRYLVAIVPLATSFCTRNKKNAIIRAAEQIVRRVTESIVRLKSVGAAIGALLWARSRGASSHDVSAASVLDA